MAREPRPGLHWAPRLTYFAGALLAVVGAILLYGIPSWRVDSIGGARPSDLSTYGGTSGLQVVTNDPQVQVSVDVLLSDSHDGGASGLVRISIPSVSDPTGFRWALVGEGRMQFRPDPDESLCGFYDSCSTTIDPYSTDLAMCASTAENLSELGDDGDAAARFASMPRTAIFGGVDGATFLGVADGGSPWHGSAAQEFAIPIWFPDLEPERTFTTVAWSVGPIGLKQSVDIGILTFTPGSCFTAMARDSGEAEVIDLNAPEVPPVYTLAVGSTDASAAVLFAQPASRSVFGGEWDVEGGERYTVVLQSQDRVELRETLTFFAGILGGLAVGFFFAALQAKQESSAKRK